MTFTAIDERLDRLVTLDLGGRGVEHLYAAARELQGGPLVGAAADALQRVERHSTVLMTTGSVSRAWISTQVGENDGPAGAAAIAKALAVGLGAHPVLVAEETLLPGIAAMLTSAGLSVLPFEEARVAALDGTLAVATVLPFPTTDEEVPEAAEQLLSKIDPVLAFSTERVGRAQDGVYYSMRAVDYGMGRARIDLLWEAARLRGVQTVAVGDGGNEIGMGSIAEAVREHVRFGKRIGAVAKTDVLVPAACSNWGCYGIVAALAARLDNADIVHTSANEAALLQRGTDLGMINSVAGVVDSNVDGIPSATHIALAEMLHAVVQASLEEVGEKRISSRSALTR